MKAVVTLIFEHLTLNKPASDSTGSLGEAVLWAVGSFAAAGCVLQLATRRLSNAAASLSKASATCCRTARSTGTNSATRRVPVSALRRIRCAAAFEREAVASSSCQDAGWAAVAGPSHYSGSHHPSTAPGSADGQHPEAAASSWVLAQSRLDGRF